MSASPVKGLDVLQVITSLAGRKRGLATALMYWLAIYPIVLIYGVSVTNTMDSFIVNQMGGPHVDRWLLATICVGVMTGAYALGKKATLWFANLLVYPLIVALAAVSLYLIPYWDLDSFMAYKSDVSLWKAMLFVLPVLVFSFSHMAAVSQSALDVQKSHDGDVAGTEKEVSKIELITCTLLVGFTMFFVWSCTLALGSDGMAVVREENIPVLSYFANTTNAPFMAVVTPVSRCARLRRRTSGTCLARRRVRSICCARLRRRLRRSGIRVWSARASISSSSYRRSLSPSSTRQS
ncbi:septum formation protein [Corynebacterium diphtheriae]|uniref:septum formation protein n=1 Tax=Corynebacterium diphtheriae TaxID=1717 RepID=UPI000A668436|nr:septum formation protein [Corynebacterium diphtheriae]CAB0552562.1 septum formation protein [Corynebacterium diphtheriae]CAB0622839.1 septum formation protein [Corynebacterium diphtheriae]CAB0734897.1 septum formation protein [Corynebacterium diphtheriae]CAB0783098.1 septum formation protein [Corynebacterium diphtheriae]CAB0811414.1 septum formation protein [Corynebacterium diphtheriae]